MSTKTLNTETEMNDEILNELDLNLDEIIESTAATEATSDEIIEMPSEDDLEAAINDVVAQVTSGTEVPTAESLTPAEEKPAKKGKAKKAEKTAADAEGAEAPSSGKKWVPRYTNSSKSTVLQHRLGEDAQNYLLLETQDAALDAEGLKKKMDEVLATIDACGQKKVQEKAVMLFSWMKKGGALNEVMARTLKVLARDGYITTGDKGNLHAELLSKPYSPGTARAQAGQMATMLPMLHIANKAEKGKLVANPESLIMMKAVAELGLKVGA